MKTYTICLVDLEQRRIVVVGGGEVALRKVRGMLESGAHPTVISPALTSELESLADAGSITVIQRPYQEGDLEDAFLVVIATDDPATNQAVWEEANHQGCLINVVDDPLHSNFIVPALLRRGEVSLAVSTGGASPTLARNLRERLETMIGPEYGQLAAIMAELRPELLTHFPPGEARRAAAQRLIDSDIVDIIQRDGYQAAMAYARNLITGK